VVLFGGIMQHLNKRIESLNNAYQDIANALKVMQSNIRTSKDGEVYFWRIEKNLESLHKLILKDLKDEVIEEEFDKIVKKFKR
jgi:hypothetical protein